MAELNIWRTITTLGGRRKTVVATVLGIATGALLWYERDDPRYPVTIDEAELIAAAYERHSVGLFTAAAPATNTVGLYPRRSVYRSLVPGLLRQAGNWFNPIYLDLWHPSYTNASEAASGWKSLLFRPYTNAAGKVEFWTGGEAMTLSWWRTKMYAYASDFGDYEYLHAPSYTLYNNARLLNEAARPLALMRWTVVMHIIDYDAWVDEDPGLEPGPGAWPGDQRYVVRWVGYGEADTIEAAYASSLAALAAAPAKWLVVYPDQWEELSSGDFACLAKQRVEYHTVYLHNCDYDPVLDIYRIWIHEEVSFIKSPHAVAPSHPHSVKSFGYYLPMHNWDSSKFWHLTEYPEEWVVSDATLVTNHPTVPGGRAYRSGHGFWSGRVPAAVIQALMPPPPSGTAEIGFRTQWGWGDDHFIFDHHFQALTNPAAVWTD